MNALLQPLEGIPSTSGPSFWVSIWDQTGPTRSYCTAGDWRHYSPEVLLQLARAAHPSLTILSAEWKPGREVGFFFEAPALVLTTPGTHEVARPKARKPRPKREPDLSEFADYGDDYSSHRQRHGYALVKEAMARPDAPAPTSVEPGPKCGCGVGHSLGSFRALPLLSASDRTEGFTAIHDESRRCVCSAPLHFTTRRLLGDQR